MCSLLTTYGYNRKIGAKVFTKFFPIFNPKDPVFDENVIIEYLHYIVFIMSLIACIVSICF